MTVWWTYIQANEEIIKRLCVIAEGIAEKDETFKFVELEAKKQNKMRVRITSPDKDTAHQRGIWFIHKTGFEGLLYWIKETGR